MKTKSKKPARKRVVRKTAKAPAAAPSSNYVVHVHPKHAEFFRPGETVAFSRLGNGHENSALSAALTKAINELREIEGQVEVMHFDAQGNSIVAP